MLIYNITARSFHILQT